MSFYSAANPCSIERSSLKYSLFVNQAQSPNSIFENNLYRLSNYHSGNASSNKSHSLNQSTFSSTVSSGAIATAVTTGTGTTSIDSSWRMTSPWLSGWMLRFQPRYGVSWLNQRDRVSPQPRLDGRLRSDWQHSRMLVRVANRIARKFVLDHFQV